MAMAAGFERIFESGPVFRAEKFASRKHATEFTGFDLEFSYIESYEDVMEMEENMLHYALKACHDKYNEEVKNILVLKLLYLLFLSHVLIFMIYIMNLKLVMAIRFLNQKKVTLLLKVKECVLNSLLKNTAMNSYL